MADVFSPPVVTPHRPLSRAASLSALLTINLLTNTLSSAQTPFKQTNWPNPTVVARTQTPEIQRSFVLTLPVATPPIGRQLESRPGPPRTVFDQPPPNLLAAGLTPVVPPDTENVFRELQIVRIIRPYPAQAEIAPNTLVLSVTNTKPFDKSDWPNPVLPLPRPSQIPPNLLTTTLLPVTPPDTENVFRELQLVRIIRPNQAQDQLVQNQTIRITAVGAPPFRQTEWPNPRIASRFRDTDIPPNLTTDVTEYVTRVALTSSQAARRIPARQPMDPVNRLALTSLAVRPFDQGDWPNPTLRRYQAPVDFIPNFLSRLIVANAKPFDKSDWQNPRLNVYRAPVDHIPNITILEPPAPPPSGGGDKKQFIGEIQSTGVYTDTIILDSSMGMT